MLTLEQKEARKKGIGASECVILFPEIPNSYCTPYELWMIKTGRLEKDDEMNDFQWWGHALEPVIAERYQLETGEKLILPTKTFIHPKYPFMLCHPDRLIMGRKKLLEIKTANYDPEKWGEPGTDQIPHEYFLQVQHQLACAEFEEGDLSVFFPDYRKSHTYYIKRDNDVIAEIEKRIYAFWNNHVLADIAPPLVALSDCRLKFKHKLDEFVEATPEIQKMLEGVKVIMGHIDEYATAKDEALIEIFKFIGEKSGIKKDDKILATWKADKNGKRTFRLSKK